MSRILLTCCLLLALCTVSSRPAFTARAQTSSNNAPTLAIKGLHAPVTIRRDERGIPHIEAANEADLYFAQGYATAQDRLWQMDLLRRTARGELAEVLGPLALEQDKQHRTYGFGALADATAAQLAPAERALLEAYAAGVNAYADALDAKSLPPEFQILQYRPRPWRPADSIIIGKIFAEALSTTWPADLARALLRDLPADKRALLLAEYTPLDLVVVGNDTGNERKSATHARVSLPQDVRTQSALFAELARMLATSESALARVGLFLPDHAASNNWVIAGRRTATGKPLLANDPHLPPSAPSIWHMVHLTAPGINVAGVTAPGGIGVIIGHNEHCAWGMTNLGPDVQDLYLEKFSADGKTYMTPQGPRAVELRHEEIKVRKGFTDNTTDTVVLDVPVTRHGPVILNKEGARYALRWTALAPNALEFRALYKLNRAQNWNEFRAALQDYSGPTQNFVYVDTAGHIGYYGAGLIPIRKSGDGSVPYAGETDEGEWTGFIPFDQLPHVTDPASGVIVTANQRIVGRSYPYFLTHQWAAPYRARRIYELLQQKNTKINSDDIRAIQGDVGSIGGANFARAAAEVLKPVAETSGDAQLRADAAALANWDGRVDVASRVAPLVAELRRGFTQRILTAALGAERARQFTWSNDYYIERLITERPADWLPKEFKDYGALLHACDTDARAALTKRLGADETQWTWGRYAQARFPHPLAAVPFIGQQFIVAPFPQQGSGSVVGATPNVGASVSMRFIADPSDWDKTQQGIALGESGLPTSPHWTDQLADWRNVTTHLFPFSKQAVAAAAKETMTLTPAQ